jgi:hypothetical protein
MPVLWLATAMTMAAPATVETHVVRHVPAQALVQTLRPLLDDGATVSAYHDRLIVKGDVDQQARVARLLRELDRPPRRLLIEVRERGAVSQADQGVQYGIARDNIELGNPPDRGAALGMTRFETRAGSNGLQRIRAIDGRPAFIRAGTDVPVVQGYRGWHGGQVVQGVQMQYRSTGTGFIAVPRVHGDRVTVEIHRRDDRAIADNRFATREASTVIDGALGQWLTVDTVGSADQDRGDGLGWHYRTRRAHESEVELRVLAVD